MSDMNRQPPKLNIFNVMSMWLFADPVAGSHKRPNLRVDVFGNVPRITVRTNVENDRNNGKIEFKTDLPTFTVAMTKLKQIAEGTAKDDLYNVDYIDDFVAGKKLDKPTIISTLQIGRDKESGRLYIAVLAPQGLNRPRIQFFFGPSKYHNIRRRDGSPLTPVEMSEAYAIGFLEPAMELVNELLIAEFNPDAKNVAKPMTPGGGGQGGGGYQQRQGGGGYQQRQGGGYQQRQAPAPAAESFDSGFDAEIPDF